MIIKSDRSCLIPLKLSSIATAKQRLYFFHIPRIFQTGHRRLRDICYLLLAYLAVDIKP